MNTIACPSCGERRNGVKDSRASDADYSMIRRRRECRVCNHRWTTFEVHADSLPHLNPPDDLIGRVWLALDMDDRFMLLQLATRLMGDTDAAR